MDKNQISTSYEKYDRVFARAFSKKQKGKIGKIHKIRPRHHRDCGDCVIPKVSVDVLTPDHLKQGKARRGRISNRT